MDFLLGGNGERLSRGGLGVGEDRGPGYLEHRLAVGRRDDSDRPGCGRSLRQHRAAGVEGVLASQGLHNDEPQAGERIDDDEENRHRAGDASHRPDLFPGDLREGATVPAEARDEDQEILHGASQDHAEDEPEKPGEVTELAGKYRSDEGPRARDRGEVVAEEHPRVRGVEVLVVVQAVGRGDRAVIKPGHPPGKEPRVIAIRKREEREDAKQDGQCMHLGSDPF